MAAPVSPDIVYHYTDKAGYDGIRATPDWKFTAAKPPGDHPKGAYFTLLGPNTPKLAKRLRIPRSKLQYYFAFADVGDLTPLPGGRGDYVLFSPTDYLVAGDRQLNHGPTGLG